MLLRAAAAAALWAAPADAGHPSSEVFTTNAICKKNRCVNPIFPGLEDLHRLDEGSWMCSTLQKASKEMSFCRNAVGYDPALPAVADAGDVDAAVRKQDNAALTMFYYHLAGIGLEAWYYREPEFSDDDCVKSIWRMVCYTYFPRAPLGCQDGMPTMYLRPCKSSCQNYLRICGVECCDESVSCVFEHTKVLSTTVSIKQTGYIAHDGPSSLCTGGSRRRGPSGLLLAGLAAYLTASLSEPLLDSLRRPRLGSALGCVALVLVALVLQGWDMDVPTHRVGNWRAEPDYLMQYEFVPPGAPAQDAMLNSCSLDMLSQTLQCGGRGVCRLWNERSLDNSLAFCMCDRDWADPECSTKRKSQVVAYLMAVFAGPFGADQFYLGFPIAGGLKLLTLGGFGVWWVADIIRIGSAPVDSRNFRVAADFPHWAFVLCTVTLAMLVGFSISYAAIAANVARRRKDAMMLQAEEEHQMAHGREPAPQDEPMRQPKSSFPDYGSTGSTRIPAFQGPRWAHEQL